jgi:hypothetical protein
MGPSTPRYPRPAPGGSPRCHRNGSRRWHRAPGGGAGTRRRPARSQPRRSVPAPASARPGRPGPARRGCRACAASPRTSGSCARAPAAGETPASAIARAPRPGTPPPPPARRHHGPCTGPRRPCGRRCCPRPGPTPRAASPDRTPGCTDHRSGSPDRPPPSSAVWPASPVPVPTRPEPGPSPQHLRALQFLSADIPLPPFPMHRAFPGSEYYGGSAPSRPDRPTAGPARRSALAARPMAGPERFPCSLFADRRRRSPAIPPRPRHGYAADLHRGLPRQPSKPPRELPAPQSGGHAPLPAQIRQVRAGGTL